MNNLIEKIKTSTANYLKSFGVDPGNLDYIDEELLFASLNAKPATAKAFQDGSSSIDKSILEKCSSKKLLLGQWSGYIYDVVEYEDKITFYTSCGVTGTPQYEVNKSDIVSIADVGICYQYTLYYIVCNV